MPIPETDQDGFLLDADSWNEELAVQLAQEEGIELTAQHWEIIRLLRNFYEEHEMSPAMRILVKLTRQALGDDKGNSSYLLHLFPDSPARRASRIAGLPRPTNCL